MADISSYIGMTCYKVPPLSGLRKSADLNSIESTNNYNKPDSKWWFSLVRRYPSGNLWIAPHAAFAMMQDPAPSADIRGEMPYGRVQRLGALLDSLKFTTYLPLLRIPFMCSWSGNFVEWEGWFISTSNCYKSSFQMTYLRFIIIGYVKHWRNLL